MPIAALPAAPGFGLYLGNDIATALAKAGR
jgi:hypothetical protein